MNNNNYYVLKLVGTFSLFIYICKSETFSPSKHLWYFPLLPVNGEQYIKMIMSSYSLWFTGLEFSQVNSHTVQPPRVVGVAMDTMASYPLSFNHSVRYVQDRLVLIG